MLQTAAFVDAGYLYAQGSALLAGSKQPRSRVRLSVPAMLADLVAEAKAVEPNARLLRIYWYDGLARGGSLNLEQKAVAESENVKCRFGTINSRGEQKGVDSLIVTDLIELARSHAISDAFIMSGDEDIRVGVQVAQTFGIRVHLLGIQPARGSQSPDLLAEADTLHEWTKNKVEEWLTVVEEAATAIGEPATVGYGEEWMPQVVEARVAGLSTSAAAAIYDFAQNNRNQIPQDFDRPALATARQAVERDLTPDERRAFRTRLLEAIRARLEPGAAES
jgi:uncharacterized LabA/DUF88 family protein